jgi:hypothetical protein
MTQHVQHGCSTSQVVRNAELTEFFKLEFLKVGAVASQSEFLQMPPELALSGWLLKCQARHPPMPGPAACHPALWLVAQEASHPQSCGHFASFLPWRCCTTASFLALTVWPSAAAYFTAADWPSRVRMLPPGPHCRPTTLQEVGMCHVRIAEGLGTPLQLSGLLAKVCKITHKPGPVAATAGQ